MIGRELRVLDEAGKTGLAHILEAFVVLYTHKDLGLAMVCFDYRFRQLKMRCQPTTSAVEWRLKQRDESPRIMTTGTMH